MDDVHARLAGLEARVLALEAKVASGTSTSTSGDARAEADDATLDGPWGDVLVIKTDPKRWRDAGKESFVGRRLSECSSAYLEELAGLFDWQADQDEKQGKTYTKKNGETAPTAPLKRGDAAKARGWARRNRVMQSMVARQDGGDDEVPF